MTAGLTFFYVSFQRNSVDRNFTQQNDGRRIAHLRLKTKKNNNVKKFAFFHLAAYITATQLTSLILFLVSSPLGLQLSSVKQGNKHSKLPSIFALDYPTQIQHTRVKCN